MLGNEILKVGRTLYKTGKGDHNTRKHTKKSEGKITLTHLKIKTMFSKKNYSLTHIDLSKPLIG